MYEYHTWMEQQLTTVWTSFEERLQGPLQIQGRLQQLLAPKEAIPSVADLPILGNIGYSPLRMLNPVGH